jgi:type IV pilus assembly protein PilM
MFEIRTGINIGHSHIEVAQIKKTLSGYQLLKHAVIEIPQEQAPEYAVGIEQLRDAEFRKSQIVSALRKVLEDNYIEPIQVIGAIPDSEIILRYFSMPFLPQKEWTNAVRFEAQKYIPFRMEEVVSDFFVIDTKDNKKKELQVVFVATKKENLSRYASLFKEAGISVSAIEIPALSSIRLFNYLNLLSKKAVTAILNIDKTSAVLSICHNTVPYLLRDFSFTQQARTEGFSEAQFPATATENLEYENLLREVQLSFDYHYKHFPALRIDKLIIAGRESLERWKEYLEKDLKIPVVISEPNRLFKKPLGLDAAMSTALGLALRGFKPQEKKIDFSIGKETSEVKASVKAEPPLLARITALELILGLSIMFAVHAIMSRQAKLINNNLTEVKKVRARLGKDFSGADKQTLLKMQKEIGQKRTVLAEIIDERFFLTTNLSELPRLLPAGVWLENIQIETKADENSGTKTIKLIMSGKAFSQNQRKSELELVNEFISNIKNNPIFASEFNKIELGFMEKSQERGFTITRFKINCSG